MHKKFFYAVLLVILISAGGEVACQKGWFKAGEDRYYDLWHQLAGQRYEPRHVVIAAIDDQTRLEHPDEPLVFWGPHYAKAISVLRQAGARVIGLDFIFVVSAEAWLKKLKLPESSLSRTFDLPLREQLAAGKVVLAGDLAMDAQGKAKVLLPPPDYWGVLPGGLDDVGLVNFFFQDQDGVIRAWAPAYPLGGGDVWLTFAQLLADKYSGKNSPERPPLGPPSLSPVLRAPSPASHSVSFSLPTPSGTPKSRGSRIK